MGYNAGSANVDGSFNTYIGYNANANAGNYSYSTAIGANSLITGSNQIVLGTSGETVVFPRIVRHIVPPILIFPGVSGQTLAASSTTTALFSTAAGSSGSTYNGTYTNIGYNSSNGRFTNNNPYTVGVTVTASIRATLTSIVSTGYMVSIISSVYGTVSSSGINCGAVSPGANCTATFPMANNDYFYVTVRNTSTSAGTQSASP
jgi:hypothetical protein